MNYFRRLYNNISLRFYSVGKLQYEKQHESRMHSRAGIGIGTRFYPTADIANLSGDARKITIGSNCHIYGLLLVYNYGGSIVIGDNCSLSEYSRIVSGKMVKIGNRVMIAHNVNILDNNSHPLDAKLRHEDFMNNYAGGMQEYDLHAREIVIEDDVWIGFNSVILKGVKIGTGAVIGAGSVVTKDVEPWTVNVGNPLRVVRRLDPVEII